MVRSEKLFANKIEKIIELYKSFMLSDGEQLSEHGKTSASQIEVELYELRKKTIVFDKLDEVFANIDHSHNELHNTLKRRLMSQKLRALEI
ncbi:hypothetical protein ES705_12680 [subsurface metagenome]